MYIVIQIFLTTCTHSSYLYTSFYTPVQNLKGLEVLLGIYHGPSVFDKLPLLGYSKPLFYWVWGKYFKTGL